MIPPMDGVPSETTTFETPGLDVHDFAEKMLDAKAKVEGKGQAAGLIFVDSGPGWVGKNRKMQEHNDQPLDVGLYFQTNSCWSG